METHYYSIQKRVVLFFSIVAAMIDSTSTYAQPAIGTTSFASATTISMLTSAPCTAGRSAVNSGYQFTLFSGSNCAMSNVAAGGTSDGHITMITTPTITGIWQEGRIASSDGSRFQLTNFVFSALTTPFLTKTLAITGYANGLPVSGATATSPFINATGVANTFTVDVSGNNNFGNIDEFRIVPSAPSDAQGTLAIMSITIAAPLPVELISFEGKRTTAENIVLDWQTISETNNKGFEIQQSADARNFTTVAYIDGKGNSSSLNSYQVALSNSDAVHYRLKQVDFDGQISYSRIIYLPGVSSEIKISPNPVKDKIVLTGDSKNTYHIYLSDILGNSVANYSGNLTQVENALNVSITKLNAGIYLLKAENNGEWQVLRFIKTD